MKKHIPNTITCLNLFTGCLAIIAITQYHNLIVAALLVFLAAIFDFFDGMAARVLKAYSEIGKDLDSLADMVSFGVVPGFMIYEMMQRCNLAAFSDSNVAIAILTYIPFVVTCFSALRLAQFNNDTRQSESFIGVPTPANTILIASLGIIATLKPELSVYILHPVFLIGLTILMSYLLVAEIPLFSLKFKHLKWVDNQIRFVFLGLSVLLFAVFFYTAIPLIIILYVILSLINNKLKLRNMKSES
jgi:CDP-diacylglycerol--serine O-phosphatidyltransferase